MSPQEAEEAVKELRSIIKDTPASVIAFKGRKGPRVEVWFAKGDYSLEAHTEMLGAWRSLGFDERDLYVFRMNGRVVSKGKWREFGDLIFHDWIENSDLLKEIA